MSTVLGERSLPAGAARRIPWIAAAAGLLFLYVPTFVGLARTLWREEEYSHGPIILAVAIYLAWRARKTVGDGRWAAGGLLLVGGLLLYLVGQSQTLPLFATASLIPVVAGMALVMGGVPLLMSLAFPLLFLAFLVPLPDSWSKQRRGRSNNSCRRSWRGSCR
jgi:hypothetical protein